MCQPIEKLTNLKNAEIWSVKFLMFNFKRVYLSFPLSDFSDDLGIKSKLNYIVFKIKEILKIKLP